MYRTKIPLLLAVVLVPLSAWSAEPERFQVDTAKDLVSLCKVAADEPQASAAIHFCHGYVVGAFHFYRATTKPSSPTEIVCLPEPPPSRNEVIDEYVGWADENPRYMKEEAVDNLFRFLEAKFPCKK